MTPLPNQKVIMADKIPKEQLVALKNQITMSKKFNEEELQPIIIESLNRYTGKHIPDIAVNWDIILNEIYPIIQYHLPTIFFRTPRTFMKPRTKTFIVKKRDPVSGKMVEMQQDAQKSATTQEHILNYLLSQIGYKDETRKVLLDALLFPYGVLWHGYKGDFGMTEEQSMVIKNEQIFIKRIPLMRFIKDPSVSMSNLSEAQWVGRLIDIPLQDLIEDDKLDVDKTIKGFKGFGQKIGSKSTNNYLDAIKNPQPNDFIVADKLLKPLLDVTSKDFQNSQSSRYVRVAEVYLRPTKKERREGKKGKILLITDEQVKPLRVNDWTIKAEGFPCKILAFNDVPDAEFGMADIDTYKSIADQKNAITNLQLRNAKDNTKVWVGLSKEGADEEDIEAVQKGDNTIVRFESGNVKDRMYVASPGGGASNELYMVTNGIQQNLEEKSGVTDLKKGVLKSGEESKFSVQQRSMGASARPAYRQDLMTDFLKGSFLYLNQLNKQFMTVKDAVRVMGTLDIEWSENPSKEEIQADVDIEIDVISMLPEDPQKEIQELQTVLSLMINSIADPAISAKIAKEGYTTNIAPVVEQLLTRLKIKDPDIFRKLKPEESEGYVSVQQMQQAQANIQAVIQNQQPPSPPQMEDDHRAKVAVYAPIVQLLTQMGQQQTQAVQLLTQLIQVHQAMIAELEKKNARPNKPVNLQKPSVMSV